MTNVRRRRDVSSAESCGFVTYLLSFPIAAAYVAWAFFPGHLLHSTGITYYPPKSLVVHLPTLAVALFVAVPFLYAGLNFLSAPSATSLDTLWDGHARKQGIEYYRGIKGRANIATVRKEEQVDRNEIISARHVACNGTRSTRKRSKISAEKALDRSSQIAKDVPEICDIDVRLINELQMKAAKNE
mmetsp:Transcript_17809/g.29599  ORF Transcript_17809/g.29599 Transcript_17809/m.29599 type:complete len:186 (-) Transcript_17809:262-819(-)